MLLAAIGLLTISLAMAVVVVLLLFSVGLPT